VNEFELLMSEVYDEGVVTEVIRPAAIVPEAATRAILVELTLRDVRMGGLWQSDPSTWRRYDRPFDGTDSGAGSSELLGTVQLAYGTPTRYEITIYRVTVTQLGDQRGWTVTTLCDEALGFGGLTLATCPRAELQAPPRPFRFGG